jgi:exo-beta-1,3-glucanase (GH17 family)
VATSYAPGTYIQTEVVTTITETDYVVFCPYTSPTPAAPVTTETAAVVQVQATTTPAAPAASTPAKSGSSSAPAGSLGTSGNQWAITYSPYENSGACKDAGSVATDIALIASKGFSAVRVYSTDCSGLQNIGSACAANGLKMILGIFISDTGISGAAQQVTDIISWQENTEVLCEVVDVVGCNIHPFFNSDVTADQAGSFVASQLTIVDSLCSGKSGINLETGWPSAGDCNGVACPGTSEQATAVAGITASAGGKSVMFSFVNDLWKDAGAFNCEQSWGAIQLFP